MNVEYVRRSIPRPLVSWKVGQALIYVFHQHLCPQSHRKSSCYIPTNCIVHREKLPGHRDFNPLSLVCVKHGLACIVPSCGRPEGADSISPQGVPDDHMQLATLLQANLPTRVCVVSFEFGGRVDRQELIRKQ